MSMRDKITASSRQGSRSEPFRHPKGRAAFPKRKTVDFTLEQADWLAEQSYDHRVSAVWIIRAALDYVAQNEEALAEVVQAAHDAEHASR